LHFSASTREPDCSTLTQHFQQGQKIYCLVVLLNKSHVHCEEDKCRCYYQTLSLGWGSCSKAALCTWTDQEFLKRGRYTPRRKWVRSSHPINGLLTDSYAAKGSSGAWVVRGSDLLGVIVAVYDNEPYAHMLPIEQVFSGIRSAYTDDTKGSANIDISLPPVDPTTTNAADV
jgi:hypothetical protein